MLEETKGLKSRISERDLDVISGFLDEFPVRLGKMAEALGLDVFKAPMSPSFSGLIQPSKATQNKFEIKLNKFETSERQRFTLAHEIAHFLLHKEDLSGGIKDTVMYRSMLSSEKEAEANKLASALIMPLSLVVQRRKELGKLDEDSLIDVMANEFKVSKQAMKIKLRIK